MLTKAQRTRDNRERLEMAVCKRCKLKLTNSEPYYDGGEFYHPDNGCVNRGKTFRMNSKVKRDKNELVPFMRKRDRRAISLGARIARKLRPK